MSQGRDLGADHPRPRCRTCGDVIGVYEPIIVECEGWARRTSLAAEPGLSAADRCFHDDCFTVIDEAAGA